MIASESTVCSLLQVDKAKKVVWQRGDDGDDDVKHRQGVDASDNEANVHDDYGEPTDDRRMDERRRRRQQRRLYEQHFWGKTVSHLRGSAAGRS